AELQLQGIASESVRTLRRVHVRYAGTDTSLACELPPCASAAFAACAAIRAEFEHAYRLRFAFLMPHRALVLEAVSVECGAGASVQHSDPSTGVAPAYDPDAKAEVRMYCFADDAPAGLRMGKLYVRDSLAVGASIHGPAVIVERNATTVVEPGWRAHTTVAGNLELCRIVDRTAMRAIDTRVDPIMLEIFNNLFMNIAEQMGLRLQNTAHSV